MFTEFPENTLNCNFYNFPVKQNLLDLALGLIWEEMCQRKLAILRWIDVPPISLTTWLVNKETFNDKSYLHNNISLWHLPNQICFQIGQECATCRGSKLTYSPGRQQLELSDLTWQICLSADIKQMMFSQAVCSIFQLERITNH